MFQYFNMKENRANTVQVYSLSDAINEYNNRLSEWRLKQFSYQREILTKTEAVNPLCEICRL